MAVRLWKKWRRVSLPLIFLGFFLSNFDFSLCSESYSQFQAEIWIDRGCGSLYSEGDPIFVYFEVKSASTSSGGSSGDTPILISQYHAPPSSDSPIAVVTIVDYYPNQTGTKPLVQDAVCALNQKYYIEGIVTCPMGCESSGLETLELIADIPIGNTSVRDTCSFNLSCSCGGHVLLSDGDDTSTGDGDDSSSENTSYSAPTCQDNDGDGYSTCDGDCRDYDDSVYPGAEDICDGKDNNCNDIIDEDCQTSSITLTVSPPSLGTGDTVTLSGSVTPPRAADIALTITKPDGESFTQPVTSIAEGIFSYSFQPDSLGTWYASATVEGTLHYSTAISNTVSFQVRIRTHLSLQATPAVVYIDEGVTISGSITPVRVVDVTISIENEKGLSHEQIVSTSSDGKFFLSYTPDSPGTWYVSATTEGTANYSAASKRVSFSVEKIPTTLSLTASSTLLYPGEKIDLEGSITPPMSTIILMTIEDKEGKKQEKEVYASSEGVFSFSYRPEIGIWSVSATFSGSEKYKDSHSSIVYFTVSKAESAISLNVSETEIIEGNPVRIAGQIRPPRSTIVSIHVENSTGEVLSFQALSKEDGMFFYLFTPESAGQWSVYAQVSEEVKYTEATSPLVFFTAIPAVPDLVVSDLSVDSFSVEPGQNVRIHFNVENLGTGTAEKITVLVSANSEIGRTIIYETTISEISPNDWRSINVDWAAVSGVSMVTIEIDPSNLISEMSEENNSARQEMDIRFKKDIFVASVSFSSEEITEGETVTITAEVHCEGDIPSSYQIEFWDGKQDEGSLIHTEVVESPSAKNVIKTQWLPKAGDHQIFVVADPEKEINEFDETNNILGGEVTVEKAFPFKEAVVFLVAIVSAGIYSYLKSVHGSVSSAGKESSRISRQSPFVIHGPSIPKALGPAQEFSSHTLYRAGKTLLKAGETTAATEIGAKLYKALYERYHHWNRAQTVDLERIAQHKKKLLQKVITHLFIFGGYIDTEEFCRFFDANESDLLDILEFLHRNGYIEEVNS